MTPLRYSLLSAGLLAAYSLAPAFSIDSASAPTVRFAPSVSFPGTLKQQFENAMNVEVQKAFGVTIDSARSQLAQFKQQKELAQGFGNANVYATGSATLQGFQNYSLFAVASGLMVGVQAPSSSLSYYNKIVDDILNKGDLYAGMGASVTFLNVGLNAKFLLPGLYLNAKYGAFSRDIKSFSMDFSVMGIGANYRFLDNVKVAAGLVKWRGVSFGTGFYRQSDKVNLKLTPDSITTQAHFREVVLSSATDAADSTAKGLLLDNMGYTKNNPDAQVSLTPTFNMGVDVSTYTIPVDAVTGVSLVFGIFNLTAGAGFDFNFGNSKIVLEGKSQANISSDTSKVTFTPATVMVNGNSSNSPSFTRLRVMTGLGLAAGPVTVDVPFIYYFKSGAAVGLTVAVVW